MWIHLGVAECHILFLGHCDLDLWPQFCHEKWSVQRCLITFHKCVVGVQWLSGRVLDSRPKGRGFEPHWRHCVVSLSKNINPSLVLVQPRKTRPYITERLLMERKESNQNKCVAC